VYSLQRPGYSLACCSHLGQETDWQIVEIGIMVLRDDLCVPGPNRGNVKKGDDALSLKDDVSGYLPRGNPAKQAVSGCVLSMTVEPGPHIFAQKGPLFGARR
jgi:hypothetical protein